MKKNIRLIVIGVLIALCIFFLAMEWLGLIFNFVSAPDLLKLNSSSSLATAGEGGFEKTVRFVQWTSLAMFCLLVPTILCFILSAFAKSKALNIAAVALGVAVVICCIVFMAVPSGYRHFGDDEVDALAMEAISSFWQALTTILIPSAILTGFAVARVVKGGNE